MRRALDLCALLQSRCLRGVRATMPLLLTSLLAQSGSEMMQNVRLLPCVLPLSQRKRPRQPREASGSQETLLLECIVPMKGPSIMLPRS